jgi:hypothetical protein
MKDIRSYLFVLCVVVSGFCLLFEWQLGRIERAIISTSNQSIIYYAHPEQLNKAVKEEQLNKAVKEARDK